MQQNIPKRVVVVEDEQSLRRLLDGFLTRAGYAVTTYASGQPLLDQLERSGGVWDVAVIDLTLPDVAGEQLAARLLAAGPEVRVVLMSGMPRSALRLLPGQERVAFIQKPFRPARLLELMA